MFDCINYSCRKISLIILNAIVRGSISWNFSKYKTISKGGLLGVSSYNIVTRLKMWIEKNVCCVIIALRKVWSQVKY